ncbi:MAG: hypothetical protein JO099_22750 [Acidobacteriia bacterium]|nr:hypothetical protein [Terriglobia bacterium]
MSWQRTGTYFAADDMMNLGNYFRLGPGRALASQFLPWRGYYRPAGAAFYLPLYHWFGLNPAPFQFTIMLLVALNAVLLFRLAVHLGAPNLIAGLAAFVVAYHAGLTNLQYNIDMVYDVLCFTFFIAALLYYVRIRRRGLPLCWQEAAVFLLLYLCAVNSKEMALTMPLVLASYEWCYRMPRERWLKLTVLSAAIAAVSLYGKKFGIDPLIEKPAYHPVISLRRFLDFQRGSLHDLFAYCATFSVAGVLILWAVVTYLAWRRNRPLLRFAWAWMLLTTLPIAFLADRFQGCLYLPLAGWAIFAATIFVDLAHAGAAALANEPLFHRLGRNGTLALLIASGVLIWVNQMRYLRTAELRPAAAAQGTLTADVIGQLRALHPRVAPHSQVVFLNDPFTDWDMTFIGLLYFGDRGVQIYNQNKEHLSGDDLARMDHVFDFRDGKLVQLR